MHVREQLDFLAFLVYLDPRERRDLRAERAHQVLMGQLDGQVSKDHKESLDHKEHQ